MDKKSNRISGFIFIEIVIAAFVFVITLAALSTSYLTMLNLVEAARATTIATRDGQNVMERIQSTDFSHIVSKFPDGAVVPPLPGETLSLQDEQIVVTYPLGTAVDPLEIQLAISYKLKQRTLSQSIRTLRTK